MQDRDGDPRIDLEGSAGTPRWVKIFGVAAAVVVVLLVILLVVGGGHGPGRHGSSASAGATTAR